MAPSTIISILISYFGILFLISYLTGKNASEESFYTGNKQSPWYLVAFGMIGASLSGITFISIPGTVEGSQFGYMQMVGGYLAGYLIIALVLMPLYYKLQLSSIYSYLETRFGRNTQLIGAGFFLISRIIGASLRMYLVVLVLQRFIFDPLNIHYSLTIFISLALIWSYTFKGGIKTIVWSDTLQTLFMLLSLIVAIVLIGNSFEWSFIESIKTASSSQYSQIFFFDDILGKKHFLKQFIGGAAIALAMTGLDQDMMQKNLSCKSLKDAQKNMLWFSIILIVVNFLFLILGALMFIYKEAHNIPMPVKDVLGELKPASDLLFPTIAMNYLGPACGAIFVVGLIAAAYSSADSALTSLTTSFSLDVLRIDKNKQRYPKHIRTIVHLGFSLILFFTILFFYKKNDSAAIFQLFTLACYSYGPLIGLFFFGIFTDKKPKDIFIPIICIIAPVLSFYLSENSKALLGGYQFGFELLLINGGITYIGLALLPKSEKSKF